MAFNIFKKLKLLVAILLIGLKDTSADFISLSTNSTIGCVAKACYSLFVCTIAHHSVIKKVLKKTFISQVITMKMVTAV